MARKGRKSARARDEIPIRENYCNGCAAANNAAPTTRLRLEVMEKIGKVGLKILASSFMCLNDTSDTY